MRRFVALLARFVSALLFRRVEVAGRDRCPTHRPVLLVANHFNGFVDPVLIAAALRRMPRFVAKAELARIPVAGFILRRVGVVFVQRRREGEAGFEGRGGAEGERGAEGNDQAFAEVHRALAKADVVAIFPEGTTHDRPRIDPLRSGAARMALGARAAGVEELVVVPVGLTFPDKIALRSSALVLFGDPIILDDVVTPGAGVADADAVRALTAVIDRELRSVIQDFPDTETAVAFETAANIALSDSELPEPTLQARHQVARRLQRATEVEGVNVRRQVGRYLTMLHGLHITDGDVIHPTSPRRLFRSAISIAVLVAILGSLVAATAVVNLWPALAVALVSLVIRTPVTKGTARVLVGLVAFPAAWLAAAVLTADGPLQGVIVVITAAAGALAAVWLIERAMALTNLLLRWRAQIERSWSAGVALEVRADVVAAVRRAIREEAQQEDLARPEAAVRSEEAVRSGEVGS